MNLIALTKTGLLLIGGSVLVSCLPNNPTTRQISTKVGEDFESIALTPQEAIEGMQLPEGYSLELVLAEPQIEEPVLAVFDGNGRMYVAEMLTYMQDGDATGEFEPTSRVSMHEDTDGDGSFDRHTIYADNLLIPRIILPLDDRIIIGETNTTDLYAYRDTDGDGVSDEKTLWYEGGPRGGNLEHQPSGLIWAQDNWLYTTYNDYRLRFTQEEVLKETIPTNEGQWGLTQDDFGKVWYVDAGGESGPVHFQQHIPYGAFNIEGQEAEDFRVVWPIDNIPDTQGGLFQLRDDNTLNHFTATCGQDIFRGDRLPEDLRGDLLFAEPVGRLIRRAKISVRDGITRLENAYEKSEFIRTKDPLFRPVNMTTAPDGTLYIVDMYRGIIQEGNWTREGSYLRGVIDEYDLDKEIGRGRIYRLVHKDFKPGPQPKMLDQSSADLVQHLSHPNGWWRDTAQKLIVLRNDKSVVPALTQLYKSSGDAKTKNHALWTLEGLDAIDEWIVESALKDPLPEIRASGIRLAEPFLETPNASPDFSPIHDLVEQSLQDQDPQVVIQAMLSLKHSGITEAKELAKSTADASSSKGVYAISDQLWRDEKEDPFLMALLGPAGLKSYRSGKKFYDSLCFTCHGPDGRGTPAGEGRTLGPPLYNSPRVLGSKTAGISILLHGLQGLVDNVDYGAPMIPMGSYSDEELANVLTYIRNSFGNRSEAVLPEEVTKVREQSANRPFWTLGELEAVVPELSIPRNRFENQSSWKLTASHNEELAALAIDDDFDTGYEAKKSPFVGMWFQVELPEKSTLKTITIDASESEDGFPVSYEVHVSDDGGIWGEAVATGNGEPFTQIHLNKPATGKFIRITLTKKEGWTPWVIENLELYGVEGAIRSI